MALSLLLLDARCEVMVILSDVKRVKQANKVTWYMRVTEVCASRASAK